MKTGNKMVIYIVLLMIFLTSCGKTQPVNETDAHYISPSLTYDSSMELTYAKEFSVDYYDGGYALITMSGGSRFLIVPEKMEVPKELAEGITVLLQPVDHIYLAASAVMDMFAAINAVDRITLSGLKEDGWYIEEARKAMAAGNMIYAGKYNMPDYERILDSGCELAIESTMILHSPEVKENLEEFGIPVLIDRSSYENHPLGRTEWVKLYGVLIDEEEAAEKAFEEQEKALEEVRSSVQNVFGTDADMGTAGNMENSKTVAFFYITSNGMVNVRKSGDYVPKMIELAGGEYVFSQLGDETASSSVNMTMEEFYAAARDADFLIYNATTGGELSSVEELLQKNPVLSDFKAVREGNVFCTMQNFYQESMKAGAFITDIHRMLLSEDREDGTFTQIYRLE